MSNEESWEQYRKFVVEKLKEQDTKLNQLVDRVGSMSVTVGAYSALAALIGSGLVQILVRRLIG